MVTVAATTYQGQCARREPAIQLLTSERATCHTPHDMGTPLITSVNRPCHQNAEHEPERVLRDRSLRRRDLLGEYRGRTVQPNIPYYLQAYACCSMPTVEKGGWRRAGNVAVVVNGQEEEARACRLLTLPHLPPPPYTTTSRLISTTLAMPRAKDPSTSGALVAQNQQDAVADGIEAFELPRSVVMKLARASQVCLVSTRFQC